MSERRVTTDGLGFWRKITTPWHPALRPYLNGYVGYWENSSMPLRMRTMPTSSVTLIINLAEPLKLITMPDPGFRSGAFASFVAGMHDGPGLYEHPGGQVGIQVDLTPLGAYRLLGAPMHALTNVAVDLSDLLGPRNDAFVDRLVETPSWAERFDLLDEVLLARLDDGPVPAPEVGRAWRLLTAGAGRVTVAELTAEVGWSRKHLINRFKEQIGLSPKVMARVLRFHRAKAMLEHEAPTSLAEVALACGYYDQAHLNREFRTLAGFTPTEMLAARVPGGGISG
ncbi:MAG: transcriptional activator FtrA [Actinomycetia bacterium]|nr:transcriptional activator FtrA [Actinomycetes bacterium]